MAVMVVVEVEGSLDDYNGIMKHLDLETDKPSGGIVHIAGSTDQGNLMVVDVWQSAEEFQQFAADRLGPAFESAGVASEPKITFVPLHNVYAPNAQVLAEMGASPHPS